MANRMYYPPQGSLNVNVVKLYGKFTIGSSGAVASSSCKGFAVTEQAAETGRYLVTLEDSYNYFLGCHVTVEVAADSAIGSSAGFIPSVRNVSVNDSTPTFDIQFSDAAGADADPTSGFVVYLEIALQNSSVNR